MKVLAIILEHQIFIFQQIVMDSLNKSNIKFQFTKGEFKDIIEKPIYEYQCWMQLKKSEQIVDTMVNPRLFIPIKKLQFRVNRPVF